jgi:hypothetical protein
VGDVVTPFIWSRNLCILVFILLVLTFPFSTELGLFHEYEAGIVAMGVGIFLFDAYAFFASKQTGDE